MRLLRMIWFRLRAHLRRDELNAELDDELRFHVERETTENMRRGMAADEARRTALAQFGGIERFKEDLRDEHRVPLLGDLSADVKHGFRLLRTNKLFSASVVLTLALGIGATSTIFAIVNGVLLQPLPYPDANAIVSVSESWKGEDRGRIGQHAYKVWKNSARSFSAVAMFGRAAATLTGNGDPVELEGFRTTPSFFSVFGTAAALGRTFEPGEDETGAPKVVVLSHELWQSEFGGDSAILNRSIALNGTAHTVVGVMRPSFGKPWKARYFVPLTIPTTAKVEYSFDMVARLRAGVTPDAALRDLQALSVRVDSLRSAASGKASPVLMTLHKRKFGSVERPLTILLCAVFVLLLIACANVANLTLARSASRQREFAVRLALGAGRARLVRQLLVESFLLAGIGGAIGTLVPVACLSVFTALSPASLAGVTDITVDAKVLAFTAGITVFVALLFGLAPALSGSRHDVSKSLSSGGARTGTTRAQRAMRSTLIVFEVAAALVLLTGAGLITKSFALALRVNPGFTAANVTTAYLSLGKSRYPETAQAVAFFEKLAQRVRALPGVEQVSVSATRPLGGFSMTAELPRSPLDPTKANIAFSEVDGQYGQTAGLRLLSGRFLNDQDVRGAPQVAMISAGVARHFFRGREAVGQQLPAMDAYGEPNSRMTVVGVVEDVAQSSLDITPVPQVFVAGAQHAMFPEYLIIRSSVTPDVMQTTLRRLVREIDPLQALSEFTSLEEELSKSVAPRRFNSMFINTFALTALILAIVGLYGLMAHSVASRTRELGIRIALGAQSDTVLQMVLRQGMRLVMVGVLIGTGTAIAFSKTLSSLLFDVPPLDPVVFIVAPLVLLLAGIAACLVPARRATQVNPIAALRQD